MIDAHGRRRDHTIEEPSRADGDCLVSSLPTPSRPGRINDDFNAEAARAHDRVAEASDSWSGARAPKGGRAHGPLPSTLECATGGGGRHLYFGRGDQRVANSVSRLGAGLDVRGDGGYVVAPPSVHDSGAAYTWVAGRKPTEVELAPVPAWLASGARAAARRIEPHEWSRLAAGASQGERNATLARVAGLAFRRMPAALAYELCHSWAADHLVPPLPEPEVVRTLDSIAKRELARRTAEADHA